MSKPLCFVAQCVGAYLLLAGYLNITEMAEGGETKIFFGLVIIIIGGMGYRRRIKR